MLHDVIAVLVIRELASMGVDLLDYAGLVALRAHVYGLLEDSAGTGVTGKFFDLPAEAAEDECQISLVVNTLKGLLDDMITIRVFHHLQDLGFEFLDKFVLFMGKHMLQSLRNVSHRSRNGACDGECRYLLNNPATVLIKRQIDHSRSHGFLEKCLVDLTAVFEKLLHNVVAKDVHHEGNGVGFNLLEDLVLLVTVGSIKFILDESRPMLVAAEFDDMAIDVLPGLSVLKDNRICHLAMTGKHIPSARSACWSYSRF